MSTTINLQSKVPIKIKSNQPSRLQISYPKLNQTNNPNNTHRRSKSDHHYNHPVLQLENQSSNLQQQILQSRRKNSIVQSTNGRVSLIKHQPPSLKQTKSTHNLRSINQPTLPNQTKRLHPIILTPSLSSTRPSLATSHSDQPTKSLHHSKSIPTLRTQTQANHELHSLPSPRPLRIRKIHRNHQTTALVPKLTNLNQREESLPEYVHSNQSTNLTKEQSITRSASSTSRDSILSDHSSSTPTTPRTATSDYSLTSDLLDSIQPLPTPSSFQFKCDTHPYQSTYSQSTKSNITQPTKPNITHPQLTRSNTTQPRLTRSNTTYQESYFNLPKPNTTLLEPLSQSTKSSTTTHPYLDSNQLNQSTRSLHTPHQASSPVTPPNHISVLLRIRRPINLPKPGQSHSLKLLNQTTVEVTNPTNAPKSHFSFDHIFGPETDSQSEIYQTLLRKNDLIKGFLNGFNATLIAYGQTGTGKSYTMGTGPSSGTRAGIIPRALEDIFNLIENPLEDSEWIVEQTVVKVAFLEVYNDELGDLLIPNTLNSLSSSNNNGRRTPTSHLGNGRIPSPSPHSFPSIQIREEKGGGISWTGLREVMVKDSIEALDQLQIGLGRRVTNATQMNAQSSRSHAIFCLMLDQQLKHKSNQVVLRRKSKFNFVDLAGSERVRKTKAEVGGERFKEGVAINSGLSALGNVISALSNSSNSTSSHHHHIPYRESKLTRLLQDSLGGNSNTMMIACVSPEVSNVGESMSTLRYASRTRDIKNKLTMNEEKVNPSTAHGNSGSHKLNEIEREELKRLRTQVLEQEQSLEIAIKPIIEEYEKTLRVMEIELNETKEHLKICLVECEDLRNRVGNDELLQMARDRLGRRNTGMGNGEDGGSDCGSALDFLLDRKDDDLDLI